MTSRRTFIKDASLLALATMAPFQSVFAAGKTTVGVIYVGARGDYGYNQAQASAAAIIKKLPNVKVVEEENVPETIAVQKTMEAMIEQDGATPIFASYFGYIDECQYLNGVVAGHMTKSKKLGFVAAKPIPQVLRNINSFTLGAQSVDPAITTQVIFTGDWSMPVKEAEATNSLVDQGCDVITCHVDGPKVVVETAEKRGAMSCGYHASQAALAPKGYLTGAEWDWATPYKELVADAQAGKPQPNVLRGGLKEGFVKMSPYGAKVTPDAKKAADAIKGSMVAGDFVIFKG